MADNVVKKLLKAEIARYRIQDRDYGIKRPRGYQSVHAFVLKHGQEFRAAALPKGIRRGTFGRCFVHALLLAMERDMIYVEGFACPGDGEQHIVQHAWCATPNKEVLDRTWKNPGTCHYFGIPFSIKFICRYVNETRMLESILTPGEGGREGGFLNSRLLQQGIDFLHKLE